MNCNIIVQVRVLYDNNAFRPTAVRTACNKIFGKVFIHTLMVHVVVHLHVYIKSITVLQ